MTFPRILTVLCVLPLLCLGADSASAEDPLITVEPPAAPQPPAVVVEEPPVVVVPPEVALQQLIEAEERRRIAIEAERRARLFNFYDYRRSVIRGRGPLLPLGQQPGDLPPGVLPNSAPAGKQPSGLPAAEQQPAAATEAGHPADLPAAEQFASGTGQEPAHPADLPGLDAGLPPLAAGSTTGATTDAAAAATALTSTPPAGSPAAGQPAAGAATNSAAPAASPAAVSTSTANVPAEGRLLRADPVSVRPGGEVTVCLRLFAPEGVARMNLELVCDPRVAVPTGVVVPGNILTEETLFTARPGAAGTIAISFQQTAGLARDGILAWVRFRAVGQPGESAPVQVSVARVQSAGFEALPLRQQPGEIQIVNQRIPGDSNGDGQVNILDAAAALRMNRQIVPEDRTLDLDQDGKITREDAQRILRQRQGTPR